MLYPKEQNKNGESTKYLLKGLWDQTRYVKAKNYCRTDLPAGLSRISWYVAHDRYNLTNRQIAEVACYLALGGLAIAGSAILIATARSRREKQWPHPPMVVPRKRDEQFTADAWKQDAVVLGYDIHGKP